ncbi:hypothetical protein NQZ79_g1939 [Umbelopsis isabellina]|nr:hypothetical protein NQZ79_g1939 [Umbelopsis isabellina]
MCADMVPMSRWEKLDRPMEYINVHKWLTSGVPGAGVLYGLHGQKDIHAHELTSVHGDKVKCHTFYPRWTNLNMPDGNPKHGYSSQNIYVYIISGQSWLNGVPLNQLSGMIFQYSVCTLASPKTYRSTPLVRVMLYSEKHEYEIDAATPPNLSKEPQTLISEMHTCWSQIPEPSVSISLHSTPTGP